MRVPIISLFLGLSALFIFSSCGKSSGGQLQGEVRKWKPGDIPTQGMVYIPTGSLNVGQVDQDIFSSYTQRPRTVSVQGFFMDEHEITNAEYREFVNWVKEYKAHEILGDFVEDDYGNEEIDWELKIDWEDEILDEMYHTADVSLTGEREMNAELLTYTYDWVDWKKASTGNYNGRRSEVVQSKTVNVYPDMFTWIRDFSYTYNEPMTRNYFEQPQYDEYPVVGVSWNQAKAFCDWRTDLWNDQRKEGTPRTEDFRLPTEIEWEYAARGGHDLTTYPWGTYYIRNAKGCLLANFKPGRGDYIADGGMQTVKVGSYFPNDYGLWDMAGNVSEWTETAYFPSSYSHMHDLNPDIKYDAKEDDPAAFKRKVIRGGSWKDVYYYLQNGTRDYEFQDTSKSYVGFRCAMTYLGRSYNDF